ncbi:MAG: cysteine desulfurase family protein [Nitrospirota bacterium]|jgi:cysteine desulfurase
MRKVFFDHISTTRPHAEVVEAMMPFFRDHFGNALSLHQFGSEPRRAVDDAREKVAALIGAAKPDEIIFTSSGTEANNLALKGIAIAQQKRGKHIVVSAIEHFSVLHSARSLEKLGWSVTTVPVDSTGLVNPEEVAKAITKETVVVSVGLANNEIGTIQDLAAVSKVCKEKNVLLHTDAIAAVGHVPVNVQALGVDLLSMAAHRFYGPKGAGALYVRKGVRISPLIDGGIQENGRRAGTEDVPAIVGFGKAAEIAKAKAPEWEASVSRLRDRVIEGIKERIDHVYFNGHPTRRHPGNVSLCVKYIEGEAMLLFLNQQGIVASSGSTCSSRALKTSHVLTAIGVDAELAQGSLMFTLGIDNDDGDVDALLEVLPKVVERLRMMSPLYTPAEGTKV